MNFPCSPLEELQGVALQKLEVVKIDRPDVKPSSAAVPCRLLGVYWAEESLERA